MVKMKKNGEEKQSGGKRPNSGRKPTGDKKIQCNFYTERCNLLLLGGKVKLRKLCIEMVEKEVAKRKKQ
jgi:hypothetical protein